MKIRDLLAAESIQLGGAAGGEAGGACGGGQRRGKLNHPGGAARRFRPLCMLSWLYFWGLDGILYQ